MSHLGTNAWALHALEDRRLMSIGPATIDDGSINDSFYDPGTKTLHVLYLNNANQDLLYKAFKDDGTSTAPVTVAQNIIIGVSQPKLGSPGVYIALTEDDNGILHAAFFDANLGDLVYARRALNGTWSTTTVDARNSTGLYPSIDINAAGNPIISYYNKTAGDLKFAEFDGARWNISVIASAGDQGRYSDLQVNPSTGRFAVAYSDDTNGVLKYAERNANIWSALTIDSVITKGASYISLDFNVNRPEIAYCDTANSDLKFAERSSRGKWSTRTLASAGDQGFYADLDYTYNTAQPAIVHYNRTGDKVELIYRNANNTWSTLTQVTGGGQNLSVADGPVINNEPPLLFLTYSDQDLLKLFIGEF